MNKRMLDGWKEIARYVGKSVKTVQRWEKEEGFPVIRIKGKKTVFGNPEEIDQWLLKRKQQNNIESFNKTIDSTNIHLENNTEKKTLGEIKLSHFVFVILVILLAIAGFQIYNYFKAKNIEKLKERKLYYQVKANGAILNITDQYGNILKTFKSENKSFRVFAFDQKYRNTLKFCDLNGDGIEDMVFGEPDTDKKKNLKIFITDTNGNLVETKSFDLSLKYYREKTNEEFDIFTFSRVEVDDINSDGKLEIIVIQNNTPFYPSYIRIFDLNGNEKFRFVHPGRLYEMHIKKIGNKKALITAGANNYIHKLSLPVTLIIKSDWKNFNNYVLDWIQPEKTNFNAMDKTEITYFTFFIDNYKISTYEEAVLSPSCQNENKLVVGGIQYTNGPKKTIKVAGMEFPVYYYICGIIFDVNGQVESKILNPVFVTNEHIENPEQYAKQHFKIFYYDGENWTEKYTPITKPFKPFKKTFQ